MQFQADILQIAIERPVVRDTTVLGIAFAAGLAVGFWDSYETLLQQRQIDRIFEPGKECGNFITWQKAVQRAKHWEE